MGWLSPVMWSVPFNLNVHDSYLAVGMVYNEAGVATASLKKQFTGSFPLLINGTVQEFIEYHLPGSWDGSGNRLIKETVHRFISLAH